MVSFLKLQFINELIIGLSKIIKNNFGVFDKFTGDGILAFYPEFFSGKDSIIYALKSANECHNYFKSFYNKSRSYFNNIRLDIGLGIGLDYGDANITNINNEISIVGRPVVYACRLSNAPAGKTYINQKAYEKIKQKKKYILNENEKEIILKNNEKLLSYEIEFDFIKYKISIPDWI